MHLCAIAWGATTYAHITKLNHFVLNISSNFSFFNSQQNGVSRAPFRAHDTEMVCAMHRTQTHITAHLSAISCRTSGFVRDIYLSPQTLRVLTLLHKDLYEKCLLLRAKPNSKWFSKTMRFYYFFSTTAFMVKEIHQRKYILHDILEWNLLHLVGILCNFLCARTSTWTYRKAES